MIDTIRLNHTVWYSYEKKIIRINISDMLPKPLPSYFYTVSGQIEYPGLVKVHSISKDVRVFGDFNPLLFLSYAPIFGSSEETKKDDWNSRVDLKWEEQHKSFDIVLPPHKDFDVDGEMAVTIYYSVYNGTEEGYTENSSSFMNSQRELKVVIPFRSHNNPVKDPDSPLYGVNAYTNVAIRNDKTNIIGALDEPVVYECELVTRDVRDENPTYRDVLDMIKIEGRKDVELELDNDTLTVKVGSLMSSVNLAKYRDENTNNTLNVEDLKRDILSIVDGKLPNVENIKQEILADVNPRIPDKETLKSEILAAVPTPSTIPYELTPDKMTQAIRDNEIEMKEFIDIVFGYSTYSNNFSFVREENTFNVYYHFNLKDGSINHFPMDKIKLLSIPFSILQNISEGTQIDVASLKNEIYSKVGQNITYNDLYNILTSFSNPEDHTYANEIITALLGKYYNQSDEYYNQHPEELENGFGNKLINHTTNILDKITKDAADREKAGKLFQKLLDAETLNVVEKTDGYELSYTGDVNKVLVKIPKQAITVSQEVLTAALTENVVTETIKPTLDKSYYSKQEVDQLIQQLKHELMSEDHAEEHPQQ